MPGTVVLNLVDYWKAVLDLLKIAIAVLGPPPRVKNLPCRIFISFDRFQTNPTDLASAVLLGLVAAAT